LQINWNQIRALNTSQREGFEELASQLARREPVAGGAFIRKGKPDAGIECYWILPSDEEYAWQAKYFLPFTKNQWPQIDDSVQKALHAHPRLVRYYVCVPVDLPDGRRDDQTSGREHWDEHVQKWIGWAAAKGMTVDFIWWGVSEMLDKMSKPENAGLVRFWFDTAAFDPDWFQNRLEEAIEAAGPRYTKEVNIDLPIVKEFDAFGRTEAWINRVKEYAAAIDKSARLASYESEKLGTHEKRAQRLVQQVKSLAASVRDIRVEPTGPLTFTGLIASCESVQNELRAFNVELLDAAQKYDAAPKTTTTPYPQNPFHSSRYRFRDLIGVLEESCSTITHTQSLAGNAFLILDGSGGMGKTHLLCDLSIKRLEASLPTILLMGQRFLAPGDPWGQTLQQLDLVRYSAEEFIGALECAAQAANARALLIIDAINEGEGRNIWPHNMSAFRTLATRSPWISLVVSVRTSYESLVLPEEILKAAPRVHHDGFADHEFDAAKSYFQHYGIELPSTPLLTPEYRTPLYLKTICLGLHEEGQTRLPRGLHGIKRVFQLYINAINKRLAKTLNFDPRTELVLQALRAFVGAFPEPRTAWLSRQDAIKVVDAHLPNRLYGSSLYQGMVTEGLLVEDLISFSDTDQREFVHVGYERIADYFSAERMLTTCREEGNPSSLGSPERLSPGVLESLFTLAPEILKQELADFAASVRENWQWENAFRQSLIWRDASVFTERTRYWFNQGITNDWGGVDALDVVLTLATVPDHPWNATFLDRQLRKRSMADRDEWWSIKLHHLFANGGSAVHRIIDWALNVKTSDRLDEDSVKQASLTLCWMFSSSNRYLRDRATKAAVALLAGRESVAAGLVQDFAEVNDLYIKERVLAVAYGVAMRSDSLEGIQLLANAVLETVFSKKPIVAHLLLRDYARGIVERLHSLDALPESTMATVRPPYGSPWPKIPSKRTIEKLDESFKGDEAKDDRRMYAGRRIIFSVMNWDFGCYVIGTNSWSTNWLSRRLSEPAWQSYSDQSKAYSETLDASEKAKWDEFVAAEQAHSFASVLATFGLLRAKDDDIELPVKARSFAETQASMERAKKELLEGLSAEHTAQLTLLWQTKKSTRDGRAPRFDLHLIQRYVAKRVFAMGWSVERFGSFDALEMPDRGREAAKAERIGKKYQWIAYHEVCAYVADNFQYRSEGGTPGHVDTFEGPWQGYFRDIDPSHSLLRTYENGESRKAW
jgi:hypothetical protein